MTSKEPVLLVVFIRNEHLRWYVAGITMEGEPVPLICSESGMLAPFQDRAFDEQVSFLRHNLSGALQRGCDRLWGKKMKPCQIIFLSESHFDPANEDLTHRVADHFVQWMANPPVVFFIQDSVQVENESSLKKIAGEMDNSSEAAMKKGLEDLVRCLSETERWEVAPKRTSNK